MNSLNKDIEMCIKYQIHVGGLILMHKNDQEYFWARIHHCRSVHTYNNNKTIHESMEKNKKKLMSLINIYNGQVELIKKLSINVDYRKSSGNLTPNNISN